MTQKVIAGDKWINVIHIDEIERDDVTHVQCRGKSLAVYDSKAGIVVSDSKCTHAGANLCDGYFDGRYIECPLHQGLFDTVTGAAKAAPAVKPLHIYESRVCENYVQIKQ